MCWILIGISRYFGSESKLQYSLYHQAFNEAVLSTFISAFAYANLPHVAIYVFNLVDLRSEASQDRISAFLHLYVFLRCLHIFSKDFTAEIQGIPLISRKVLVYGMDVLSEKERTNIDSIRKYQIRNGELCYYSEDSFNLFFHHALMCAMSGMLFVLFYCGFEFARLVACAVEFLSSMVDAFAEAQSGRPAG